MSTINRVTQRTVAQRSLAGLQANLTRVGKLQQQLSSGKQISRPSDSPAGTAAALQFRGEIRRNAAWSNNADDGLGLLGQLDNTLMGMNTSVQKVRELTLQGLNSGAMSPEARNALATQIDQLRESLFADANQTYLGRPIFGGTTPGGVAFQADRSVDPPVYSFVGDNQPVMRTVGANSRVQVDLSGSKALSLPGGTDGADLLNTLTKISQDLRNDPTQLGADLTHVTDLNQNLLAQLSDVGARENRLAQARQAADDRGMNLTNSLSEVENIDLPETIMKLEMANVGYQAALGATAKAIQPSLMDFLK